jgi:diketogulonate reductase-like aldo/keto reductase
MAPARSRDEQALQALHTALDLGYTHLDTAEMYGAGHTEELIGRAIQGRDRKEFFLTTKVSASNLRYADVLRALDRSLARLKTSYQHPFGRDLQSTEPGSARAESSPCWGK